MFQENQGKQKYKTKGTANLTASRLSLRCWLPVLSTFNSLISCTRSGPIILGGSTHNSINKNEISSLERTCFTLLVKKKSELTFSHDKSAHKNIRTTGSTSQGGEMSWLFEKQKKFKEHISQTDSQPSIIPV